MKSVFFLLLLFNSICYGQCKWSDMFPFKGGDTKFEVVNKINMNSNIVDNEGIEELDKIFSEYDNRYVKYEYLKDSVYISVFDKRIKSNKCVNTSDNSMLLKLSNDKLHRGEITFNYSKDEYDLMLEQYNLIQNTIPESFKYYIDYNRYNSETEEQIGKGVKYKETKEEQKQENLHYISVGYAIEFERVLNNVKTKYITTNKVVGYTLEVSFVDLRYSVLTGEGF